MKKYTIEDLKKEWVKFVEDRPVDENYNYILSFICSLESEESESK